MAGPHLSKLGQMLRETRCGEHARAAPCVRVVGPAMNRLSGACRAKHIHRTCSTHPLYNPRRPSFRMMVATAATRRAQVSLACSVGRERRNKRETHRSTRRCTRSRAPGLSARPSASASAANRPGT